MADPTRHHEPLDDDRLRAAYLAAGDGAGPHLSESEWEQLACGELDADAHARAHAHITGCARCAKIHDSLTVLAEGAGQFDPHAVTRPAARPRSRVWMTLGGLAAAAAIVAAVLVDLRVTRTEPAAEVIRNQGGSTAIAIVAPQPDAVLQERRFTWQAVLTAESYEFRINTADGGAVWSTRVTAAEAVAPATLSLPAGRYYWQVTAVRENAVIASSPLIAFRVE